MFILNSQRWVNTHRSEWMEDIIVSFLEIFQDLAWLQGVVKLDFNYWGISFYLSFSLISVVSTHLILFYCEYLRYNTSPCLLAELTGGYNPEQWALQEVGRVKAALTGRRRCCIGRDELMEMQPLVGGWSKVLRKDAAMPDNDDILKKAWIIILKF